MIITDGTLIILATAAALFWLGVLYRQMYRCPYCRSYKTKRWTGTYRSCVACGKEF